MDKHDEFPEIIGPMNISLEAIVSFDEDQRIVQFDRQAEEMFGYSVAEALQKTLSALFPYYSENKYETQLKLFARNSNGSRRDGWLEMQAVRGNGEEFPVEVDITKFRVNGKYVFTAIFKETAEV